MNIPGGPCNLDEYRFFDGDYVGYEIVCVNRFHQNYVCPREGEMFRQLRSHR